MNVDNRPVKNAVKAFRKRKSWELRLKGYTQREIGKELHINQAAVCRYLKRQLRNITNIS